MPSRGSAQVFIPDILDTSIIDDVMLIDDEDAYQSARRLGMEEGLLVAFRPAPTYAPA